MSSGKIQALALVTDAFGGRGGIATYNRSMLRALCAYPNVARVRVIPRLVIYELEVMPKNLEFQIDAAGGKWRYIFACLKTILSNDRLDVIICAHLHLLPIAKVIGLIYRCPVIPIIYGTDAWRPTASKIVNYICHNLESFISIRHLTARRFIEWAKMPNSHYYYLPNCIDPSNCGVRERRLDLISRYNLTGKTVIMTTGRMDSGHDLNKGFEEMLSVLPELRKRIPNLVYMAVGDGEDKERLIAIAKKLDVSDVTVFTGYILESEKADHYRLADVFAMPGSNPEFDRYPYRFVFLEALACGVPVLGSKLEDITEVNDPESRLIIQVDPNNKCEIIDGVMTALALPQAKILAGLENFYFANFQKRFHKILTEIITNNNS